MLSFDQAGALVASAAFALLIVPHLGQMSASLAFGILNLMVAGLSLWLFRARMSRTLVAVWALALAVSVLGRSQTERRVSVAEARLDDDEIVLSTASPCQQITVTRFRDRFRLFLDASIQFDSQDEYRDHGMLGCRRWRWRWPRGARRC